MATGDEMLSDVTKKLGITLPQRPIPNNPFPAGTVHWPFPSRVPSKFKGASGGKSARPHGGTKPMVKGRGPHVKKHPLPWT